MKKIYLLATTFIAAILGVIFSIQPIQPVSATGNVRIGSSAPADSPVIIITSPADGSQISGIVSVDAEASSSAGVRLVDFRVDGAPIASDSAYPYSVLWDTTALAASSWHLIEAIVYDYADATASASVSVQIAPSPTPTPIPTPTPSPTPTPIPVPTPTPTPSPEPTPIPVPTISITYPLDGSMVKRGSLVKIVAEASDSYGINRVEFFVNNNLTCIDSVFSYTCDWKVPLRYKIPYTLTAKAYNIFGGTASDSIVVTAR